MARPKGSLSKCAACGELGHNASTHLSLQHTNCSTCDAELTADTSVPNYSRKHRNSAVTGIGPLCKSCFNKRACKIMAKTYRTNLSTKFRLMLANAKKRAYGTDKYRKASYLRDFEMDVAYLHSLYDRQSGKCYYTGVEMSMDPGHLTISMDCLTPRKGYVPGNIVLCCWLFNNMKCHLTEQEFYERCQQILDYRNEQKRDPS